MHTVSRNFQFRTVKFILNEQKSSEEEMINGVIRSIRIYEVRGLRVTQINADNKFECLEDLIRPAALHTVGANKHVGDVERSVRTVNECNRCYVQRLSFQRYPKIMVAGMDTT